MVVEVVGCCSVFVFCVAHAHNRPACFYAGHLRMMDPVCVCCISSHPVRPFAFGRLGTGVVWRARSVLALGPLRGRWGSLLPHPC